VDNLQQSIKTLWKTVKKLKKRYIDKVDHMTYYGMQHTDQSSQHCIL